jgi:hypothetical protein
MSLLVSTMTRDTMTQIHTLGYTVSVAVVTSRWTATAKNYETGRSHVVTADTQEQVMADLAARVWTDHLQGLSTPRFGKRNDWNSGFVS